MKLVFLGTGAGNGVPVFYCNCKVCAEAKSYPKFRRTRCSIAILGNNNLLIDAPPEISSQLLRENITAIDYIFFTHSHHDHCAGLGDIEIYTRFYRGARLPAVMSSETFDELTKFWGRLDEYLNINFIKPFQKLTLPDFTFTALEVSHAPGTLGFLFENCFSRSAYMPDTGPLPRNTMSYLKGIDNLILDATFWGENWYPDQHLTVFEAIRLAEQLEVKRLYLTHLSMHYSTPVTSSEIEQEIQKFNGKINLACDGMVIDLDEPGIQLNNVPKMICENETNYGDERRYFQEALSLINN